MFPVPQAGLPSTTAGFRAIRLDIVRDSGPSAAELVARSFEELREYLLDE